MLIYINTKIKSLEQQLAFLRTLADAQTDERVQDETVARKEEVRKELRTLYSMRNLLVG